jgi:GH15 family glucan-1,4-alpha-glucosidase
VETYPAIEDHGLIGDLQTAALVTNDGTIDWFCAPRFDSPTVFAALLDRRRGGYFRIAPTGTAYVSKQLYLPGTSILITRFLSADGVGEVIDFMPIAGDRVTDRHRLVRMVRVVRGRMRFAFDCQPRFNYGRDGHETELSPDGAVFHSGTQVLDAALLYMPLVGFVAPTDPMWQSTLRAMDSELVSASLVYRYDPSASPDGLRGSEGTFTMCTFWYVEALARSGRLDDARLTFEKMLTYSSPLGLYSEEIAPTGEQLGNFPQAFSHLALIGSAVSLDRQLGHRW